MDGYRFAAVCKNGHCINHLLDRTFTNEKFCDECGAEVLVVCPSCKVGIRGLHYSYSVADSTRYIVPAYCYSCGSAFPWTESAIQCAAAIIEEEECFSSDEKQRLIAVLPDIISETPKTNLAISRFNRALATAGKFTVEGIRQFVIDFGCEFVKREFNLY